MNSVDGVSGQDAHVHQRRVAEAGNDLAVKRNSALPDFLRIADVEGCSLGKLVMLVPVTLLDHIHDLFTAKGNLAAYGVLSRDNVLAEAV